MSAVAAKVAQRVLLLLASTLVSLLALELTLRGLYEPPPFPRGSPSAFFWQRDSRVGWTGKPDVEGYYSNGRYRGHVVTDMHGHRLNSVQGTFDANYRNVFFLGDSTTASLEVDNDQTVPAILEHELRQRGMEINVLNLGVRGYGTDQSVMQALYHAERYRPEQIIYMYTDNDLYDANVLKLPRPSYGKGAYLRREEAFTAYNYPVPRYERGFYGAIVLDPESRPVPYTGTVPAKPDTAKPDTAKLDAVAPPVPWRLRFSDRLERSSHAYRGILGLKRTVWPATERQRKMREWKRRRADPWEVISDDQATVDDVFYALFHGCADGGVARLEHRDYYESQLAHLVGMLWQIPSVRRIHLVEFPSEATLELMSEGRPSTNRQLFEGLLHQGLINSYVNLNLALKDQRLSLRRLTCPEDPHFCDQGNRWIVETMLSQVSFAE